MIKWAFGQFEGWLHDRAFPQGNTASELQEFGVSVAPRGMRFQHVEMDENGDITFMWQPTAQTRLWRWLFFLLARMNWI